MRRTPTKEPQCASPRLHELRVGAGPRRERGQEYSRGRAGPWGSPSVGGGNEPRSPFPLGMGSMSRAYSTGWWCRRRRRAPHSSGPRHRPCTRMLSTRWTASARWCRWPFSEIGQPVQPPTTRHKTVLASSCEHKPWHSVQAYADRALRDREGAAAIVGPGDHGERRAHATRRLTAGSDLFARARGCSLPAPSRARSRPARCRWCTEVAAGRPTPSQARTRAGRRCRRPAR